MDRSDRLLRNHLLASLTDAQQTLIGPHLEPVDLRRGEVLEVPSEPIAFAYFPDSALLSVVAVGRNGKRIEIGLIGRDGMSGLAVNVGDDRSPHETQVQMSGTGHRVAAKALRHVMSTDPEIREKLLLYVQVFAVQTAHTVLSQGWHTIEQRLARWLLMCQDRVARQELDLTHDILALMLGVRRAGITVATQALEARGAIRANRGRIRILDRHGLEELAQGSYGVPEAEYARLLGVDLRRG